MGKIKQYRNVVSAFISSEDGQRFFNFAYSIGAAIVIWGALFKILHLPGGNTLLSIGMGTEVLMFILTAFDRPPKEYHWENVYPGLINHDEPVSLPQEGEDTVEGENVSGTDGGTHIMGGNGVSGTVIIGGGNVPGGVVAGGTPAVAGGTVVLGGSGVIGGGVVGGNVSASMGNAEAGEDLADQMQSISTEMQQLREITHRLNEVSATLLDSYKAITENSDNITANSAGYVEQMQSLNRNIQGLNTIYEIQLKSVSSQLDAIDRVNRGIKEISDMYMNTAGNSERYCQETEKMAQNMKRLNSVYEKMLTAMTINMYPGMAAAVGTPTVATDDTATDENKE